MSLRGQPVVERATLGDGREVDVRIAVPEDPYVDRSALDTVAVELRRGDEVLATVNSILEPGQTSEARALARAIAAGLESGELEPTPSAIGPFAERLPDA